MSGIAGAADSADPTPAQQLSPSASGDGAGADGAEPTGSALSADVLSLDQSPPDEVEDLSFSREGAYLGAGGTYAVDDFDIPGDQKDSATIVFRAGYRGYSWLSVDFLGEVITSFEGDDSLDNDVDGYAVTVNARVIAPLGRVEPWVMFGIGFLDMDEDQSRSSDDDLAFRPAAGFDLYLTPHWAIYGEAAYMIGTGDVADYDFATFGGGLLFRF